MPRVDMVAVDAVDIMALWTRGVWLADAADYFAKRILVSKADEPTHRSLARMVGDNVGKHMRPDLKQDFTAVVDAVEVMERDVSAGIRARSQAAASVLQALQAGRLIAFGYLVPRNAASAPQQIPPDLFHSRHIENWRECWSKSVIRSAGLHFVSVRVVRPNWVVKISAPPPSAKPEPVIAPRRKPGRPSSRDAITEAIQALFAQGKLSPANSLKKHFGLIRERVHELYPSLFPGDKGLADQTIAKYLAAERARAQTHKL